MIATAHAPLSAPSFLLLLLLLQVLESTIMYQDQVAAFKTAMQMHLQSEEPDPATDSELSSGRDSDVQLPDSTSYMISLINRAHPALVQQVLDWEATDWHNWLAGAAYQVCMLLQLTERGSQATGSAPAYVCTAEQDVNKVGLVSCCAGLACPPACCAGPACRPACCGAATLIDVSTLTVSPTECGAVSRS